MFLIHRNNKQKAFTLAEVLITMAILGVIAALTIPTLISNYNRRVWATRLEKDYTIAVNMCERMLEQENAEHITELNLYNHLLVGGNIEADISQYIQLNGAITVSDIQQLPGNKMLMPDGSEMYISRDNRIFRFYVDVNGGDKFPNIYGKDRFAFDLNDSCEYNQNATNAAFRTFDTTIRNEWSIPQDPS
jgi:prepilin-type N-terminal cleavage/methylation domain-containing protein